MKASTGATIAPARSRQRSTLRRSIRSSMALRAYAKGEIRGNSIAPRRHADSELAQLGAIERGVARANRSGLPLLRENRLDRKLDARLTHRLAGELIPADGSSGGGVIEGVSRGAR